MTDDVVLNPGVGGDSARAIDYGDSKGKRQVVALDGGAGSKAENVINAGMQLRANTFSFGRVYDEPVTPAEAEIIDLLQRLIGQVGGFSAVSPFQELAQNIKSSLFDAMARQNPASNLPAVEDTFTAVSASKKTFNPIDSRPFNVWVWGTFVGTVQLERSFNNGASWFALTAGGTQLYLFTSAASETAQEDELSCIYRMNCTLYTSGTIFTRISQ